MIDQRSGRVLCVATSRGKTHDFALFKETRLAIAPTIELLADTGYLGVDKLHSNSSIPYKKSKCHPLTPEQKKHNRALATRRIRVEHAIRYLKRFRILSTTYRNKRKRFALRLNLLAAIANLHR